MIRTVSVLALAAAFGAGLATPAALAAPASGRGGTVVQQRENRADADQWKRSESKSHEDDDDDRKHSDRSKDEDDEDEAKHPRHPGELNGKLDLGDW